MRSKIRCLAILLLLAFPAVLPAQYIFTTNNNQITITQYTGPGGTVTIPNSTNGFPITVVGSTAFFQIVGLTNLTFGTNVQIISDNAVFQCHHLTNVNIPASVTNIGLGPFFDCKGLLTISVNSTNTHYTNVGSVLFNKALTSLIQFPGGAPGSYTVPQTVTDVGVAFIGNSLSSIVVTPANTIFTNLGGALFSKDLKQLIVYPGAAVGTYTVPTNVNLIIGGAFEYATGVTNVIIGTNVTSIGQFAFFDCENLRAISVNSTNAFYSTTNGVLFDKAKKLLIQFPSGIGGSYAVPNTVTNIEAGAFADSFQLSGVIIPNSVTNIDQQAFYGCTNLSLVIFGSSLKSIGQLAFFDCISLPAIVFPASLKSLGFEAFAGCFKLSSACFNGNQPTDGGSVFLFDNLLTQILHVNGTTGWGGTYSGISTAFCPACSTPAPVLGIAKVGTNVFVAWPSAFAGFTLQSTTNLVPPITWSNVTTAPFIVNQLNIVSNSMTVPRKFFRLLGP